MAHDPCLPSYDKVDVDFFILHTSIVRIGKGLRLWALYNGVTMMKIYNQRHGRLTVDLNTALKNTFNKYTSVKYYEMPN